MHRVLADNGVLYLGLGNRLGIIEPHYKLPFLSYLPPSLADRYVRASGRADHYYERMNSPARPTPDGGRLQRLGVHPAGHPGPRHVPQSRRRPAGTAAHPRRGPAGCPPRRSDLRLDRDEVRRSAEGPAGAGRSDPPLTGQLFRLGSRVPMPLLGDDPAHGDDKVTDHAEHARHHGDSQGLGTLQDGREQDDKRQLRAPAPAGAKNTRKPATQASAYAPTERTNASDPPRAATST